MSKILVDAIDALNGSAGTIRAEFTVGSGASAMKVKIEQSATGIQCLTIRSETIMVQGVPWQARIELNAQFIFWMRQLLDAGGANGEAALATADDAFYKAIRGIQ